MNQRFFKLGVISSALALLLIVGVSVSAHGASARGGGKKPSPPANPVIVFRAGTDIVVADKNGGNQTVVYRNFTWPNIATWCSPDGTDLIFQHELNGQPGIYRLRIIDTSSGNRTVQVGAPQLVASTPFINPFVSARCSPEPINGEIKVVYDAQPADAFGNPSPYTNLYLANVRNGEDGNPTLLLSGNETETQPRLGLSSPSWSPAGDRIAFSATPWDTDGPSDVKVLQLNEPLGLTNPQSLILDLGMVSPLYLRPPDGQDFFYPLWSNTSELIAVDAGPSHTDLNAGRQLWLIPADSPEFAEALNYDKDEGVQRYSPSWSPDDGQLVYVRNPRKGMCGEGGGNVQGTAVGLSNVNGSRIVKNGISCDEIAIIRDGRFPDWWRGAPQQ